MLPLASHIPLLAEALTRYLNPLSSKGDGWYSERKKGSDKQRRKNRINNKISRRSRKINAFRARGPKHKRIRKRMKGVT